MQKLFFYYGTFDKNGEWTDNASELEKELKEGGEISNSLLSDAKFTNIKNENDPIFEKYVVQYVLEKKGKEAFENEAIRLELSLGLTPLVDKKKKGNLLDEIDNIRKAAFFPEVRIIPNSSLNSNEYQLFSYNVQITKGAVNDDDIFEKKVSTVIKIIFTIKYKRDYPRTAGGF